MVVVTGASGQLGRAVIEGLLGRLPANRIVASVRDPAKAMALAEQGVQVRAGDFADPDGLAAAFAGAEQVLVISVDKLGEQALRMHRAAIAAARTAGTRRVLYTSHMGARGDPPFAPAPDHAAAEALLADGGAPFTSLRHGFYAESALHPIGHGLEAFTMADLAAVASDLTGREVKRVTVSDDEWRDATVAQGVPAPSCRCWLSRQSGAAPQAETVNLVPRAAT